MLIKKRYFFIFGILFFLFNFVYAEEFLLDSTFNSEEFVSGLNLPTSMMFIENDKILVLEKSTGNVRLIKNGNLMEEPILTFNVDSKSERGLLGIAKDENFVYIFLSESNKKGGEAIANRIYQYEWKNESLLNPVLLYELPVNSPRWVHNGGVMTTGLDDTVYAVIGDSDNEGKLQNFNEGKVDDSGIILIVNKNPILKPSLSDNPFEYYYAIGIRNSFGLTIDPETGYLWDTENGDTRNDEINLVKPKFNSGWKKIMGPAPNKQIINQLQFPEYEYSDPEFSWELPIAPTGLVFVNSDKFEDYKNNLFVAGFNTGSIYNFQLNEKRNGFVFNDANLDDLQQHTSDSAGDILFGTGFNGVTDLDIGPDGSLYALSLFEGKIIRIFPSKTQLPYDTAIIPDWVKENSKKWSENNLEDILFLHNIEFLVESKIIILNQTPEDFHTKTLIPYWFKQTAQWWADDLIPQSDFLFALNHLINKGFVQIDKYWIRCNVLSGNDIDLSGCDLSNKEFSNLNLVKANFKDIVFVNSTANNSVFFLADFSGGNLTNSQIINSNLQEVKFFNTYMPGVDFSGSDLSNAKLRNADIQGSKIIDVEAFNTDFSFADMSYSDFSGSILKKANFSYSNLLGSQFIKSKLHAADFTQANLRDTLFFNSGLSQAKLYDADLQFSNLEKSNLQNAKLVNTNLANANLVNVNFKNALIKNANFANSNLTNADFTDARIENSNFKGSITLNCKNCPN